MSETTSNLPLNCDIQQYSVLALHAVKCKPSGKEVLEVAPDIKIVTGKPEFQVLIVCTRNIGDFSFQCAIEGSFVFHEPISANNVLNAWVNGCTILYGIARNLFSVSAMQCVHKDLMLPAVMMIDVIKRTIDDLRKKQEAKVETAQDTQSSSLVKTK